MPITKLLGITGTQTPYIAETNGNSNFIKNTFSFGSANPNRPEGRNLNPYAGVLKGANVYCLA